MCPKILDHYNIPRDHPFSTEHDPLNDKQKKLVTRVIELYGGLSAISLSNFTHLEESPWHSVYNDATNSSAEIKPSSIAGYFKSWIVNAKQKADS